MNAALKGDVRFQAARLSPPHNLPRRWASRSVDEAIETLASPDVTVTNQSDKELQLYKLRELDSLVQEAVAQCESEAADPALVEIAPAPDRGSNSIFERAE